MDTTAKIQKVISRLKDKQKQTSHQGVSRNRHSEIEFPCSLGEYELI
jgi:hypothetical protein